MRKSVFGTIAAAVAISALFAGAAEAQRKGVAIEPPLPPEASWSGKSESLIAAANDPWITPAEASGFERTASYDETVTWLRRLEKSDKRIRLVSLGRSPLGRDIWMVVASKHGAFSPNAVRKSGKAVVFFQAGIHSGEIDGKEAGMMLLRDIVVRGTKRELLDDAVILFVPVFNVDGHERVEEFGRINQRGPKNAGWRNTAQNLNLNRDYAKADTPEMRAMLRALQAWQPDLYVDIHVTDGADYQYDVTFGFNDDWGWSPSISRWLRSTLTPALDRDLRAMGHHPGPLVQGVAGDDLTKGIYNWSASPRFSNGYGDAVHIPTVLIENHSLKNFRRRVLGAYVTMESMTRAVIANRDSLREAIAADRNARPATVPLSFGARDGENPTIELDGIEARFEPSPISGDIRTSFTGRPVKLSVPLVLYDKVTASATRPKAYWIPPTKADVIERLRAHGIAMETIREPRTLEVEMYRLTDSKLDVGRPWEPNPFEGRMRMTATPVMETRRETFPAGSVRVPTDQPLGVMAMILLEPASPDSLFRWGLFNEVLARIEYYESYVLEPVAEAMLAGDSELAKEFRAKLEDDKEFRGDAAKRLDWFYAKTRFQDDRWLLYPVGRER
ncbi:MAG: M14 family metallopeptidase [Thermoanaerobaculia bacterium]|nr:M14 family metallopeptidase [Thermoanaerobaculia bacterium]